MKKSCDKPCTPSDYAPGGYCDKQGCYKREDLSILGEFYEDVRLLVKDKLEVHEIGHLIELYRLAKEKQDKKLRIEFTRVKNQKGFHLHVLCGGNIANLQGVPKTEIAQIFFKVSLHMFNEYDKMEMDIEEQKIAKSIDGMETAPGEKINEGNNPKSQFNENDIL